MLLKRLELTGFKSFAKPTTLEFASSVTAVVGPNGAGKSNIAEAIRFVLGEQSIKSLRGKRSEDLIFHGTKNIARLNRASVSIVFDNRKKIFDIDYDEVEVKRVVYRDSMSEYFINGSKSRLKDIIELLAYVHIGASGHHIISQGEADRILNASIKERRTMIEDALGLKIYQYKRLESERKLKKTEENIHQVESLRREIAPHLSFLEKQIEKIHHAEALQEELRTLLKEYVRIESAYFQNQEESLRVEKNIPRKELEETERLLKEQEDRLRESRLHEKKNQEILDMEEALREMYAKKDDISRTCGRLEGVLEYEEKRVAKGELDEKEVSISISQKSLEDAEDAIKEHIARAETVEDSGLLKKIIVDIQKTVSDFFNLYLKEGDELKKEKAEAMKLYEKTKEEKRIAEQDLKNIQEEEKKLFTLYRNKKEMLEKNRSEERFLERQLFELRNKSTEIKTRLELLTVKEDRLQEEKKHFQEEVEEARHIVGEDISGAIKNTEESFQGDRKEQETRRRKIERLKIKLEDTDSGGSEVMKEYTEVKERDQFLARETEDLAKSARALNGLIKELGEKIDNEFKEGIKKINTEFQSSFTLMFGGGTASIKVTAPISKKKKEEKIKIEGEENPEDILFLEEEEEEGVEMHVSLPHKRVKGLAMLSGGERALTSIALIFAIIQVKPPPFLVLDETDAALDETNSKKYGSLLKNLSEKTQLIIITHNRETMSQAGVLYGVTNTADGISRLLGIKLEEAVEIAE